MKSRLVLLVAAIALIGASAPIGPATASIPRTFLGRQITLAAEVSETTFAMTARAATADPARQTQPLLVGRQPKRADLPQDRASSRLHATAQPKRGAPTGPKIAAQTTSTQLLGTQLSESGSVPPDSMGAVGPTQFVVIVNGRIRSFNKTTGAPDGVLDFSTDAFFNSVRNAAGTSDPRIRYDRLTQRWFFTMVNVTKPSNRVMVAFTDPSPTLSGGTMYHRTYLNVAALHPNCFWDYDTLGVDANALYVGGNVFCGTGVTQIFTQTDGLVMSKAQLFANTPTAIDFAMAGNGTSCPGSQGLSGDEGPYTPQGVDNYDPKATVGYFIGVSVCVFGRLDITRITNPGSTSPSASIQLLSVPMTDFPIPATAMGTGGTRNLDTLDDRLFAAHIRNGHLYTAHNIGLDNTGAVPVNPGNRDRDAARWYDVTNLETAAILNQSGTVFDSALTNPRFFYIPSIMVSGQGHAAMGTSVSGATEHAEDAVMGRWASDASGAMKDVVVYQTSIFDYAPPGDTGTPYRWGDYSYTSLDPNDDMTVWTIQEYANATNSWGVEAVKLLAPPPATPASTDGTALSTNECSQLITITGTSTNGSGFFDPGPSFANRLQASVGGGVTVNHVTYTDPTHITLDLSTQGASAGLKDLTVTNPDGQSTTATGFLTVGGASTVPDTQTAASLGQYTLTNSDGAAWQEIDSVLRVGCAPVANQSILLTANADLFTGNAGYNQDIGIFVSDNGAADQLLAWKESGGFAGTFSPNAAFVQWLYPMVAGHTYVFKLKWKTNKAASGATIWAGASPTFPYSQTSLAGESFPTGVVPNFAVSTSQYTNVNSDGTTWKDIDVANLQTTLIPGANSTAVLGANIDLFTGDAGYNQDIAIWVSDNAAPDVMVAWKESGGFAGTFSPNAAFVKATYPMVAGHAYVFKLKWVTNKNAAGKTIYAAAGPFPGPFSPSSLFAETIPSGTNPFMQASTAQYTLPNSDGATWQELDTGLRVTVSPAGNTNSLLGANIDLFTGNAGYNQDVAIFVSDNGGADNLLVWKESGGFAGIFSPNAAFAQTTFRMSGGHIYVFKLKWKTNRNAPGSTIFAAAGPFPGPFSPTRLTVELTN